MEKNASKHKTGRDSLARRKTGEGEPRSGEGKVERALIPTFSHPSDGRRGAAWIAVGLLALAISSCRWKLRPTFPASRIASSLRTMCSTDYKLSIEARFEKKVLQALVWKVGLFKGESHELQGMNREGLDAIDHVLLCATRIALSTDAALDFIEVKIADVLSGTTVTLWRYVPDIRDSMYQRIGDTEYFNRLVIEIDPGPEGQIPRKVEQPWDRPVTLTEFLAKQIILRARREGADTLQAHADFSEPTTLDVVIDNWPSIKEEGPDHARKVTDLMHQSAEKVIEGYRFHGFHGMILRDNDGVALKSWSF